MVCRLGFFLLFVILMSCTKAQSILIDSLMVKDSTHINTFISIHTLPESSKIFIDNSFAGINPLDSFQITNGLHKIRIAYDGYKVFTRHIFVSPENKKFTDIVLKPDFGFISLNTDPSDAQVFIDSIKCDSGGISVLKLSAGYHSIQVSHPSIKNKITERIFINPGVHTQLKAPLHGYSFKSAFYSIVIPGLGQILDGSYLKGTLELLSTVGMGFLVKSLHQEQLTQRDKLMFAYFKYKLASTDAAAIIERNNVLKASHNFNTAKNKVTMSIIGLSAVYLLNIVDALIFNSTVKRFEVKHTEIPTDQLQYFGNQSFYKMGVKVEL